MATRLLRHGVSDVAVRVAIRMEMEVFDAKDASRSVVAEAVGSVERSGCVRTVDLEIHPLLRVQP